MNAFFNPYPSAQGSRVQTWVSREDYQFLQRIRVDKGTVTTAVNLLFAKLVAELRSRGIDDHTKVNEFEEFVSKCKLTN